MKKQRLALPLALLAGALLPFAAFAAPSDSRLAGVYLEQARALDAAGAFDAAARMLRISVEFDPGSSEALYLLGTVELRSQEGTRAGIRHLARAISLGAWTETDPDAARIALARAELRTGRLTEALRVLGPLAARRPEDPRVAFLRAVGSLAEGSLGKALAETSEAIKAFPREEGFYLLACGISLRRGDRAGARAAVQAGLRELPGSLHLVLRAAELEPEPGRRITAVDAYNARGGADPLAPVIALEAGPKAPEKYLALFLSRRGLSRLDLTRRVAVVSAGSGPLSAAFRQELSRFTGAVDLDGEGEGFWTERWEYVEGQPVRWSRDHDRDGVPEQVIDFKDGTPSSMTVYEQDSSIPPAGTLYHFDVYPYLDSVSQSIPGGVRTWQLSPRSLGCPVLEGSARLDAVDPRVTERFSVPTASQVQLSAFSVEERTDAGALVRRTSTRNGKPEYVEEDTDGDGLIDHKLWLEAGVPARGLRDLDASGTFPVSETYRNGLPVRMSADLDRDGFPEYAEEHEGGKLVKLWDYNGSGSYDAREYTTGKGVTVREFSTAFNGRFDLRVTWRNGELRGVEKDGRSLPVSRDTSSGITWIGTPSRDPVSARAVRDGPIVIGGRAFLAFHFGGALYLEELR